MGGKAPPIKASVRTRAAKPTLAIDGPLMPLKLDPRNCHLQPYAAGLELPVMQIAGDFIAYASPDSAYAVTKRLFDSRARLPAALICA